MHCALTPRSGHIYMYNTVNLLFNMIVNVVLIKLKLAIAAYIFQTHRSQAPKRIETSKPSQLFL